MSSSMSRRLKYVFWLVFRPSSMISLISTLRNELNPNSGWKKKKCFIHKNSHLSTNSIKVKVKKSYCSRQNCYQCFFMRRALWFFVIGLIARDNYCVSILCFSLFQQSSCSPYRLTTIDWQQRFWFNPSKRNFKGKRPCSTDQTVHVHEIVKRVLTEFLPPAVLRS